MTRLSGRYGVVLGATLVVLLVVIVMPGGRRDEAAALVLQGLLLAITLRVVEQDRRGRLAAGAIALASAMTAAALITDIPRWAVVTASAIFLVTTMAVVAQGIIRQLQREGVSASVIAGALALYLLGGLLFATLIGAVAVGTSTPYFAQGTDGAPADRVYFSFITLTTTGYGDLTPGTPVGRALAVSEVLLGQIYLVTVVALLVGNLRRR
jgi:Ion channel